MWEQDGQEAFFLRIKMNGKEKSIVEAIRKELDFPLDISDDELFEGFRGTFTVARIELGLAMEALHRSIKISLKDIYILDIFKWL